MKDILIIIPAYNEEKSIAAVLEGLESFKEESDLIVINDGSLDHTADVVKKYPVYLITHPINLGYGAALQTAYRFADERGYRSVVQFDADGQHHSDDLRQLMNEMRKGSDDIVIGSRILGDPSFAPGVRKRIASLWFNSMIRLLTKRKVTDPTSGLRGFSRRAYSYYATSSAYPNDFPDADTIIHMVYQGFRVREFPVRSQPRKDGKSRIHSGLVKHAVYMLKVTISILAIFVHHHLIDRGKTL